MKALSAWLHLQKKKVGDRTPRADIRSTDRECRADNLANRNNAGLAVLIPAMTKHVERPFSATLSKLDLALVGCLQALAAFSEQASHDYRPSAEERDWRAAG